MDFGALYFSLPSMVGLYYQSLAWVLSSSSADEVITVNGDHGQQCDTGSLQGSTTPSGKCEPDTGFQSPVHGTTDDVNVFTKSPTPEGKGHRLNIFTKAPTPGRGNPWKCDKATQVELPQNIDDFDVHISAHSHTGFVPESAVEKSTTQTSFSSRSRSSADSLFYVGSSLFPRSSEYGALGDLVQQMRQQNARLADYLSALNLLFSQRDYNQAPDDDQNDRQVQLTQTSEFMIL